MKFAIITDIHLGPEGHFKGVHRKINKDVKVYLENFVAEMNDVEKPEFVVVLGDIVEDDNEVNDKQNLDYLIALFKKLQCPVYYVAGNHDLQNISEVELEGKFEQKELYYSFEKGDYNFIVLYTKSAKHKDAVVSAEQVEWLKKELKETKKKTIIFCHYTLADQDLAENPWFSTGPEYCLVKNRSETREILAESKKVIAVFNGHLHWARQHIHDNIPYFTIQSLVENEEDKGIASEAHAVVKLKENQVSVEIKGQYAKKFSYLG